jgi:hypothetical protein
MEDLKKNNDQVQKNKEKEKEKIKEKLKAVFDKYGYDDDERRKKILGLMVFNYCLNKTLEKTIFPDNYEVAKLIKVLRQCKEVVVTGTIENPQNDMERKEQLAKTTICSRYTFLFLDLFLNTLLEDQQDGLYQFRFDWEFKEEIDDEPNGYNFTEPYTKNELEQIIEYEKGNYIKKRTRKKLTPKQLLGQSLSLVETQMLDAGFFSGKSEGKAREYAFLFDCYVAIERIPVPDYEMTDSNKYTFVKDCIRTYQNHPGKSRRT